MDIELRVPLLRWLESASLPSLRQATHLLSQRQARLLFTQAAEQALTYALPLPLAADARTPTDAASATSATWPLPVAVRQQVCRLVEESGEALTELADFVLTEQLRAVDDSVFSLRQHVGRLIQQSAHEELRLLFDEFCREKKKDAPTYRRRSSSTSFSAADTSVTTSALARPPAAAPAPVTPSSMSAPEAQQETDNVTRVDVSATATSEEEVSNSGDIKGEEASQATPQQNTDATAILTPSSDAEPATAVETASASSSSASSSASSSSSPSSSLLAHSCDNLSMDVLCLLLSFVGCWDLLSICSRVSRRWFKASLDPRCFRQIRSMRLTQFMEPEAAPLSRGEWNWNAPAPPVQELYVATAADYSSFSRMLSKLANLQRLDLGPRTPNAALTAVGDGMLLQQPSTTFFTYLSQLRSLNLSGCSTITDEGIRGMVRHCQGHPLSVSVASLPSSSSSSSAVSPAASTPPTPLSACFLHRLQQLDLSECRGLTDAGLSLLFPHLPSLRHLNLSYCSGAGLLTFQSLARHCPRVTRLNLAGARGVNDDVLRAVAGGLIHLRTLNIEDCWSVTATGIMHIARGCKALRDLNCSSTYNGVTDMALQAIVQRCGHSLLTLHFNGCPLTDASVKVLMQGQPEYGIQGVQQLQELHMSMLGRMGPSAADLSDEAIRAIASARAASTLLTLDLTACNITNEAIRLLAGSCTSLQHLILSRCAGLSDGSIVAIGSGSFASTLVSLDVSHVYQLTDACLPFIRRCKSMQSLNLRQCLRITDQCWTLLHPAAARSSSSTSIDSPHMAESASPTFALRSLDVSACKVSDHGLRRLSHAYQRSMHLRVASQASEASSSPRGREQGEANIQTGSTSSSSSPASQSSLRRSSFSIAGSFSHLTSLSLNDCTSVSDAGLCSLLPFLPHLTSLSLVGCSLLTSRTLACMSRLSRRLRKLLLHQCVELTDASIETVTAALPGLYELGLDELNLSNASLLAIARNCTEMQRLSMARAPHITFHGLYALLANCLHLKQLNCSLAAHLTALQASHPDATWQQVQQMVARRGVQFLR